MTNSTKKIGVFFGAGAEIGYGMPDGGRFAIDVFRTKQDEAKKLFREALKKIDLEARHYTTDYLPKGFQGNSVTVFGKAQLASIFKGSLKAHRKDLKAQLEDFDGLTKSILSDNELERVKQLLARLAAVDDIDDFSLGAKVGLTEKLKSADSKDLFDNVLLSAALQATSKLSQRDNDPGDDEKAQIVIDKKCRNELKALLNAVIEMYLGAVGEDTVERLNNQLFIIDSSLDEAAKNLLDGFDGIFRLDYGQLGMSALEYVIEQSIPNDVPEKADDHLLIQRFIFVVLRRIVASCINYQELIDSHWRYLYSPREEWGKFTKISIFLEGVRLYVEEIRQGARTDYDQATSNYYHDIIEVGKKTEKLVIGTSNYTDLLETIARPNERVYYLNGNVKERYDPYTNEMHQTTKPSGNRLTVPLLFTQSGIKPLTSIEMAKRYVRLYEHYEDCETLAIVGFGFNGDDGHINGMFRQLCEQSKKLKRLIIFHFNPTFSESSDDLKKTYKNKLRLSTKNKLEVISVDANGKLDNGELWYTAVI